MKVCATSDLPDGPYYINEHTLVRVESTGELHLFGIFRSEPADPEHEGCSPNQAHPRLKPHTLDFLRKRRLSPTQSFPVELL